MIQLEHTQDYSLIKVFYTHPELWARIAEDGCSPDDYEPDHGASYFKIVADNGRVIGVVQIDDIDEGVIRAHCNVLKTYRPRYADDVGQAIITYFVDDSVADLMIAEVAEIYPDVIRFCEKHGLRESDRLENSIEKNGRYYDEIVLSITREQAKTLLEQPMEAS